MTLPFTIDPSLIWNIIIVGSLIGLGYVLVRSSVVFSKNEDPAMKEETDHIFGSIENAKTESDFEKVAFEIESFDSKYYYLDIADLVTAMHSRLDEKRNTKISIVQKLSFLG